jgi:hypothetical protein
MTNDECARSGFERKAIRHSDIRHSAQQRGVDQSTRLPMVSRRN